MPQRIAVKIDHDLCVGNGMCVAIAAEGFELDDNGQAVAKDPNAEPLETILEAAASCPVGAITVIDADTGEEIDFE